MPFPICGRNFRPTRFKMIIIMTVATFLIITQMSLLRMSLTSSSRNTELTKNSNIGEHFLATAIRYTMKNLNITRALPTTTKQFESKSDSIFTTVSSAMTGSSPSSSNPKMVSTLQTKVIDMENDYQPFVNFTFIWPKTKPILPGIRKKTFMLVILINSGAHGMKYRLRRRAIRETWGKKTCEQRNLAQNSSNYNWLLVFSLGKTYDDEDQANFIEASVNNDMLIGDFKDAYINNVIKVYMGHLWVSTLHVRYILKTDDDVYVRVPATIDWLVKREMPTRFYGGGTYLRTVVDHDVGSKWGVSKKYFNETFYPPFNAGAFYILSTDTLNELSKYVHVRPPFHTDDAYIGVAARDLKINVTHILGFRIENNMASLIREFSDCYLVTLEAFGHSLEPENLKSLHNRLENICMKNITDSC